ncbi:MAG TPA: hypothetical protein VFI29_07615 [Hanamia sp.]|nr:hypothetical protein [Hanamia sp.]
MLQGFSTQNGTGITIYGDYCDLRSLYLTIDKIAEKVSQIEDDPRYVTLMGFSYDVRKAYSEQRLKEEITFDGDRKIEYFGFQFLWPDLLIFISVLRYQASYSIMNELDQSNLYLLEHITKKALEEYDQVGVTLLKNLIGQQINILDPLLVQINEFINIEYLKLKPSKKRFRDLYLLISNNFSSWTKESKNLKIFLEEKAKELGATADKISFDEKGFPEVVW